MRGRTSAKKRFDRKFHRLQKSEQKRTLRLAEENGEALLREYVSKLKTEIGFFHKIILLFSKKRYVELLEEKIMGS